MTRLFFHYLAVHDYEISPILPNSKSARVGSKFCQIQKPQNYQSYLKIYQSEICFPKSDHTDRFLASLSHAFQRCNWSRNVWWLTCFSALSDHALMVLRSLFHSLHPPRSQRIKTIWYGHWERERDYKNEADLLRYLQAVWPGKIAKCL